MRSGAGQISLKPELLLDTHVLVRWLVDADRLSRDQVRALHGAVARGGLLATSAFTLIEIAMLFGRGSRCKGVSAQELFGSLGYDVGIQVVPIDLTVAAEVAAMGDALRDPGDRVIVATARVHGLQLVTSDQRIIESKLVRVVC